MPYSLEEKAAARKTIAEIVTPLLATARLGGDRPAWVPQQISFEGFPKPHEVKHQRNGQQKIGNIPLPDLKTAERFKSAVLRLINPQQDFDRFNKCFDWYPTAGFCATEINIFEIKDEGLRFLRKQGVDFNTKPEHGETASEMVQIVEQQKEQRKTLLEQHHDMLTPFEKNMDYRSAFERFYFKGIDAPGIEILTNALTNLGYTPTVAEDTNGATQVVVVGEEAVKLATNLKEAGINNYYGVAGIANTLAQRA